MTHNGIIYVLPSYAPSFHYLEYIKIKNNNSLKEFDHINDIQSNN